MNKFHSWRSYFCASSPVQWAVCPQHWETEQPTPADESLWLVWKASEAGGSQRWSRGLALTPGLRDLRDTSPRSTSVDTVAMHATQRCEAELSAASPLRTWNAGGAARRTGTSCLSSKLAQPLSSAAQLLATLCILFRLCVHPTWLILACRILFSVLWLKLPCS